MEEYEWVEEGENEVEQVGEKKKELAGARGEVGKKRKRVFKRVLEKKVETVEGGRKKAKMGENMKKDGIGDDKKEKKKIPVKKIPKTNSRESGKPKKAEEKKLEEGRKGNVKTLIAGLGEKDKQKPMKEKEDLQLETPEFSEEIQSDVRNLNKEHCSGNETKDDLAFDCD